MCILLIPSPISSGNRGNNHRAQIVDRHKWSSAGAHVYKDADPVLSDDCYLLESVKDWREYLDEKENSVMTSTLFQNTKAGRPCGDEVFISTIEGIIGRRLTALPVGRPRKAK